MANVRPIGVLTNTPVAKRLTDKAIDAMEGVQNLRKAILTSVCCTG
jgi:hypothetical protein